MSTKDNGGQAFPCYEQGGHGVELTDTGMTLRDYFAAKSMQAVRLGQPELHDIPAAYQRIAEHSYKMADAMLKARSA